MGWTVEESKTAGKTVSLIVNDGEKQSEVVVTLYGAHVISWSETRKEENKETTRSDFIFTSEKAVLDGSKAIRGGIPVIFPQFSEFGPLPRHGFARTSDQWEIDQEASSNPQQESDDTVVVFVLRNNRTTAAVWQQKFTLTYTVRLSGAVGSTLTCTMHVKNDNEKDSIGFTAALHTYFRVGNVAEVEVGGLHKLKYMDQTQNKQTFTQEEKAVTFVGETDRVYYNAPNYLTLVDNNLNRQISMSHTGFADAVVWNPWEKARDMSDMADDEYKVMVCVEAAAVDKCIDVAAQGTWTGVASYTAVNTLPNQTGSKM